MRLRGLVYCLGAIAFGVAAQACVVRDATPVNPGYGCYGYGCGPGFQTTAMMATPTPYSVSSMPPQPLYEQMSPSPGPGYVWVDGYWHWNGYEWVWVSGRWERDQDGYVYVEPYYDYVDGAYIYTPGYWSSPDRVPAGWQVRDHRRDGRPRSFAPPPGWHTQHPPQPGIGGGGGVRPGPWQPPGQGGVRPGLPPGPRPISQPPGIRPIEPEPPRPIGPRPISQPPVGIEPEPPRPVGIGPVQPAEPPPSRGAAEPGGYPVAPPIQSRPPVAPPPAPIYHPAAPPMPSGPPMPSAPPPHAAPPAAPPPHAAPPAQTTTHHR